MDPALITNSNVKGVKCMVSALALPSFTVVVSVVHLLPSRKATITFLSFGTFTPSMSNESLTGLSKCVPSGP